MELLFDEFVELLARLAPPAKKESQKFFSSAVGAAAAVEKLPPPWIGLHTFLETQVRGPTSSHGARAARV